MNAVHRLGGVMLESEIRHAAAVGELHELAGVGARQSDLSAAPDIRDAGVHTGIEVDADGRIGAADGVRPCGAGHGRADRQRDGC